MYDRVHTIGYLQTVTRTFEDFKYIYEASAYFRASSTSFYLYTCDRDMVNINTYTGAKIAGFPADNQVTVYCAANNSYWVYYMITGILV